MDYLRSKKEYIERILQSKKEGKIEDLDTNRFLRKNIKAQVEVIYLGEDDNGRFIALYTPCKRYLKKAEDVQTLDDFRQQSYFELVELIFLLKVLEENKYIYLSKTGDHKKSKTGDHKKNSSFDRDEYEDNSFEPDSATINRKRRKGEKRGEEVTLLGSKFYGEIVTLFEQYSSCVIFPLETLNKLVENDFKSLDQRRFEIQLSWVRGSFIAAIIVPFLTTLLLIRCSPETKLDEDQYITIKSLVEKSRNEDSLQKQIVPTSKDVLKSKRLRE